MAAHGTDSASLFLASIFLYSLVTTKYPKEHQNLGLRDAQPILLLKQSESMTSFAELDKSC